MDEQKKPEDKDSPMFASFLIEVFGIAGISWGMLILVDNGGYNKEVGYLLVIGGFFLLIGIIGMIVTYFEEKGNKW